MHPLARMALSALLTAAPACSIDIDVETTSDGDSGGTTTGDVVTPGSTGLGASETGDPGSTTSTGSASTSEGSSSEGTTTGGAEHCAPSPADGSCTCVVYDGVCACPNGHYPSSACVEACACDLPDDALPCGLVVLDGYPMCTCVDTPADPAECGCAMVGGVCACGANIYPLETCSML